MAQDLFQVLDGIEIDADDLREAEVFAVNYLQPIYPDLDLREGTALRDTSIRVAATLLALAKKGFTYYFTINSLDNATDQTPEETINALLSNFFLTRKQGANSKIQTRLFFSIQKDVSISSSLFFSPDNDRFYFPVESVSATKDNMKLDASRQQYYLDVELESETSGEQYNIESGQLLFFSTFDPFFVGGDILYLTQRSIPIEKNSEFIARAGSAISTRNLINQPSIESRILETFNLFTNVTSIGMGEEEMVRDLITVRTGIPPEFIKVHNGGHVDVYVQSEVEIIEEQLILDPLEGGFVLEGEFSSVFSIERVEGDTDTIPFDTESPVLGFDDELTTVRYVPLLDKYNTLGAPIEPKYDLGLSSKQRTIIKLLDSDGNINNHFPFGTATFRMRRVTGLQSLQAFFDDSMSRVLCADLLARSYEIYDLTINIQTHTPTTITPSAADLYVRQYVSSLKPGAPFVMSECMEILSRDAGIENMVTPMQVSYTLIKKNLEEETGDFTSILTPNRLQRFLVNTVTLDGKSM